MARLSFYPIADSYLLVALVGAAMLGLLVLIGPRAGTSRPRRWTLAGVRLAVIVLVLAALLRPTLVTVETKHRDATLVLMADVSRSMSVPDESGGRKTRYEALAECLDGARGALADLVAARIKVEVFAFDAKARRLDMTDGRVALPKSPEGNETAIGWVLEDLLKRQAGNRLLGIVLLSDGAQRAYAPRDVAPQTAAAQMRRLGERLYAVPFGQARGLGNARDVAVKGLLVDQNVFVKNELSVSAQVRVDGYVNREIPVRLRFETSPGKMTVVAQTTLKPQSDGQLLPVELTYVPEVPGQYKLTLEVPEQPGELVTTNNRLSTFVNVLAGGLNVLYVEGFPPRPDTKFLKQSLDASPDIDVDLVTLTPRQQPGGLADRFKPGQYAVYILGDVDSTAFTQDELKNLAEAVSRGAGLIMVGGFQTFGAGGYDATPLNDVLPV
ncbi:MAG: hypothetical protein JW818_09140, partial [Pirellulales bacterium]|nr:hypothetical protein [Pirellulales bacterium]